jgi:hypothetical protein
MARAKKPEEPVITYLIIDKQELKDIIVQREKIGTELIDRTINNPEEKQKHWDDFLSWNKYNEELIKQAFDIPDNSYAYEFTYRPGIGFGFYGNHRQKSFQETVEDNKSAMRSQLKKLRWFYEKIDLLRSNVKPREKPDEVQTGLNQLIRHLNRFHKVAQALRHRHDSRETLLITDEYDVQDLLYGLLQLHFSDVRTEDASPGHAGANSRLDFTMRDEKFIIEVKMTSEKYSTKKIGDDLLIDIGRYKEYPYGSHLIIFVYDKGDHIRNKHGFVTDLQKQSTDKMKVTAIINPL